MDLSIISISITTISISVATTTNATNTRIISSPSSPCSAGVGGIVTGGDLNNKMKWVLRQNLLGGAAATEAEVDDGRVRCCFQGLGHGI
ncbi:hypothetical protein C5167_033507 [Papaver somniferum]|uniref:Uncharacterized protein n=1 Tax=Papaver somniferum TaxID=3469 RepID=A0A4Y7KED8_PAPSO|nr:hypothetical protein C5167_033507 [Papaver somniferum]